MFSLEQFVRRVRVKVPLNIVNVRPMVTASQLRAARSWLGLSQDQVAANAMLTRTTIVRAERDPALVQERTLRDVRKFYESQGIHFLFRDGIAIGISTEPADP
jgi:DNA-binding XRE family transcriptional regulator